MGQIITFYSYKGGVGRTFALTNVAAQLSLWGYKVLVIDWDLEAPGVHHYFGPHLSPPLSAGVFCDRPGLLEYFKRWPKEKAASISGYLQAARLHSAAHPIQLLFAGIQGPDYGSRARGIPWTSLYAEHGLGMHLTTFGDQWREEYDLILIDSRTGLSDTAGICTVQLPYVVAFVLTASYQSVSGTMHVAARIKEARAASPDPHGSLPSSNPLSLRREGGSRFRETLAGHHRQQPCRTRRSVVSTRPLRRAAC